MDAEGWQGPLSGFPVVHLRFLGYTLSLYIKYAQLGLAPGQSMKGVAAPLVPVWIRPCYEKAFEKMEFKQQA